MELSKDQELVLFRVYQEVISNAIKYARANSLEVSYLESPIDALVFQDDGKGFDL